jgi:hypothetical protein
MFNIAHAQQGSKLIASEKAGLFGWHNDRGTMCQGNIETNPSFNHSCKK